MSRSPAAPVSPDRGGFRAAAGDEVPCGLADASRLARNFSALARQVADLQDSPVLAGLGPDFPAPSAGTDPAVDLAEPQLMSYLERRLGRMLREELRGQLRLQLRNLGIEPLAPRGPSSVPSAWSVPVSAATSVLVTGRDRPTVPFGVAVSAPAAALGGNTVTTPAHPGPCGACACPMYATSTPILPVT